MALVTALPGKPAAQSPVTLNPKQDNTIFQEAGDLSNGAGQHLFAGRVGALGGGQIRRALLVFDVAGNVPMGATIVSVTLTLQMSRTSIVAGPRSVSLHRVLAAWGEGTSDATLNEGMGAPATAGDATWLYRFFNTDLWAAEGGDFAPAASASTTVNNIGSYAWSGSAMRDEVRDWLDDPGSNFGWILIGDESTLSTSKRFDAREHPVAANRPQLSITYSGGGECLVTKTGDVNVNGAITSADIIYLVNFVFKGGPAPLPCPASGDVNCSGNVTSADIIALVNFVFKGGSAPCDVCSLILAGTWSCS